MLPLSEPPKPVGSEWASVNSCAAQFMSLFVIVAVYVSVAPCTPLCDDGLSDTDGCAVTHAGATVNVAVFELAPLDASVAVAVIVLLPAEAEALAVTFHVALELAPAAITSGVAEYVALQPPGSVDERANEPGAQPVSLFVTVTVYAAVAPASAVCDDGEIATVGAACVQVGATTYDAVPLPVPLAPLVADTPTEYVLGAAPPSEVALIETDVDAPEASVTEPCAGETVQPPGPVPASVNVELPHAESVFVIVAEYDSVPPAVLVCVLGEIATVGVPRVHVGTTT